MDFVFIVFVHLLYNISKMHKNNIMFVYIYEGHKWFCTPKETK